MARLFASASECTLDPVSGVLRVSAACKCLFAVLGGTARVHWIPAQSVQDLLVPTSQGAHLNRRVHTPIVGRSCQGQQSNPYCVLTCALRSGIIGSRLPKYSVCGDTMNTASRMESTCVPGQCCILQDRQPHLSGIMRLLARFPQAQCTTHCSTTCKRCANVGMIMLPCLHLPPSTPRPHSDLVRHLFPAHGQRCLRP